jgi:hypothetical protein
MHYKVITCIFYVAAVLSGYIPGGVKEESVDNLWSSLSQQVQAQLGRPLPEHPPYDAANPEFLVLLNQLRGADPDLAEKVLDAYVGTSERLPSEVEAAAERRRQRVQRFLLARFVRPDGLRSGRIRLHLRRTLNWIAVTVTVLIILWSLIPRGTRVSAPVPRLIPARPQLTTEPMPRFASPTVTVTPPPPSALSSEPLLIPLAGPPPSVPSTADGPLGSLTRAPGRYVPGYASTTLSVPGAPASTTVQVVVFEAGQSQSSSSSLVVYEREETQVITRQPLIGDHALSGGAADLPRSPVPVVVYDAHAGRESTGSRMVSPGAPDSVDHTAPAALHGQVVEGRLVMPVAVTSMGVVAPAVVEITQGPWRGELLLGQATRSPEGLVLMQFNARIVTDGKEYPFRGAAYDVTAGRFGMAGQVSTIMPGASAALLAATMQTTSDYFKARAYQQRATTVDGFPPPTPGTPNIWDGLAAAVARAFAPITPPTTGPTVVTRLENGQTVTVLVM